jgi:hypothetical protein
MCISSHVALGEGVQVDVDVRILKECTSLLSGNSSGLYV